MSVLDRIAGFLGYARPVRSTGFAAAQVDRLTAALAQETRNINDVLRYDLRRLRARSRQAAQNNPYARRFVKMVVNNVAGPTPFRLQSKVKFKTGNLDTTANRRMEEEWGLWGKVGNCELSGRHSLSEILRLLVKILATDGELLLRRYRGKEYGRHGYQVQLIDVDRLDDMKNQALPGGGAIHMGVQVDAQNRPVGYHLLKRKPAHWISGARGETEFVPADDVLHVFIPDAAEQVRGIPWRLR